MGYKKERLILLVRVVLIKYFDVKVIKTEADLTKYIEANVKSKHITIDEGKRIIKHFEREIFPLSRNVVSWMMHTFKKDDINFNTRFKEMKKLIKNNG